MTPRAPPESLTVLFRRQDEVLAIHDKLTLRLEDLASVVVGGDGWAAGLPTAAAHDPAAPAAVFRSTGTNARLDLDDVARAKRQIGEIRTQ